MLGIHNVVDSPKKGYQEDAEVQYDADPGSTSGPRSSIKSWTNFISCLLGNMQAPVLMLSIFFDCHREEVHSLLLRLQFDIAAERALGKQVLQIRFVSIDQLPVQEAIHEHPVRIRFVKITYDEPAAGFEVFVAAGDEGDEKPSVQIIRQSGGVDHVELTVSLFGTTQSPSNHVVVH